MPTSILNMYPLTLLQLSSSSAQSRSGGGRELVGISDVKVTSPEQGQETQEVSNCRCNVLVSSVCVQVMVSVEVETPAVTLRQKKLAPEDNSSTAQLILAGLPSVMVHVC